MEYDETMKSKGAVKAFERFIKELKTDSDGIVNFEGKLLELGGLAIKSAVVDGKVG